jgi:hypothetical protein
MWTKLSAKIKIALLSVVVSFGLSFFTDYDYFVVLALSFSFNSLLTYLHTIGKKINILELTVLMFSIQLLFVPAITYIINPGFIPLQPDEYFGYVLPAIIAYYLGTEAVFYKNLSHTALLKKAQEFLVGKEVIAYALTGLGLVGLLVVPIAPSSIRNIAFMLASLHFVAVIYGYYSGGRTRYIILLVATVAILIRTAQTGLFWELYAWSVLWLSIIGMSLKWVKGWLFKVTLVLIGALVINLIQSVKFEYRKMTWGDTVSQESASTALLWKLMSDRLERPEQVFNVEQSVETSNRLQANLLCEAMIYVPRYTPYSGKALLDLVAAFIPRFLWEDKPTTGGAQNAYNYTFQQLDESAIDITILGVAYVSFGVLGGILFMFSYGLLLNYVFQLVIKLSDQRPTLILWLPFIFYSALKIEFDLLNSWGGIVIASVFLTAFIQLLQRFNVRI